MNDQTRLLKFSNTTIDNDLSDSKVNYVFKPMFDKSNLTIDQIEIILYNYVVKISQIFSLSSLVRLGC